MRGMKNRTFKGYRARLPDDGPDHHLYLAISSSPNGPFISSRPERPRPLTRGVVKAMMDEWESLGCEPYKLCKVWSMG